MRILTASLSKYLILCNESDGKTYLNSNQIITIVRSGIDSVQTTIERLGQLS